ncbi:GNAT family N-acetyltransferase [Microbacterium sp. LWH11-1.2]|uniref:GNAT family N-acetyltransferase n=1 Tax=Microbacterium sp. LWH11-1.2 TaxID=3135258 RepID=UPI00313A269C
MTDLRARAEVTLRPAESADLDWLADLRAIVLRADLERLGRYDAVRVRQRLRDAYDPSVTRTVVVDGEDVGCIAVRREDDTYWIEHFYLARSHQGRGVGGRILTMVLQDDVLYRLNVLQGSAARRLYERHGFVVDREDEVDVFMSLDRTGRIEESGDR